MLTYFSYIQFQYDLKLFRTTLKLQLNKIETRSFCYFHSAIFDNFNAIVKIHISNK